jgi:hemerythrin superfamily protein
MDIKGAVNRVLGREDEPSAPDALTLIKNDHRETEALFKTALDDNEKPAARRKAIAQVLDALDVHTRMEEAIFYPALRKAGGKDEKDSVLEADEEHAGAKSLIAKIRATPAGDETLKAKVTVLKEQIEHHVREEESTMFSEARKVLGDQLDALGAAMFAYKNQAKAKHLASAPNAGGLVKTTSTGRMSTPHAAPAKKTSTRKSPASTTAPARKKTTAKRAGARTR